MSASERLSRRRVLRGMLEGAAVSLALPFLDCFLDENGEALAATGEALPACFGTWFYGCGFNPGRWEPKTTGPDYQFGIELEPLAPLRHKINVYSGMNAWLDGRPPTAHAIAPAVMVQGVAPPIAGQTLGPGPTLDSLIADVIGTRTRFRSLEVSCTGSAKSSHSQREGDAPNPSEVSPLALYIRVFGPGFKDPNAVTFTPDPAVVVRRSVLSAVSEQTRSLQRQLGAADRAHLDEYLTSLRELEQQLDLQLQKPAPLAACSLPPKPPDTPVGGEVGEVTVNHRLFSKILAHALACDQTRLVNVMQTDGLSQIRFAGEANTLHLFTHEDPIDERLGYQPNVAKFYPVNLGMFSTFLGELDAIREGERTLLDRTLVLNYTDSGFAKNHTTDNVPILTAGSGGGRVKTGFHFAAPKGDPLTRVSLTVMQALGVPISTFGSESNRTAKTITEVMV
jgi:Protein of unknown function (DUF1552)